MNRVRMTEAQLGAVMCRDWSEDPAMRHQITNGVLMHSVLIFYDYERDTLASEINDASNAEDDHAAELRRAGHLDCAQHAARAARVLANLYGNVLRARSVTRAGKSGA